MSSSLVKISLLQTATVIFNVIFVGLSLKLRFGSGSHFPILATYVRDYGIILLLIPFTWAVWGVVKINRPKPGVGDASWVFLTGVGLLVALAAFGFLSFISVWTYKSLVLVE